MSKDKAADYFSRHQSDECHITSDERVFHTLGAAQSFASGLKDTKVTSYTRAEVEAPVVEALEDEEKTDLTFNVPIKKIEPLKDEAPKDDTPKDEAPKGEASQDEAKVQALEALKNFDATTALYPEIKALFKDLGLDAPTQKQPDLLAAIEAYKTAINTEVKE